MPRIGHNSDGPESSKAHYLPTTHATEAEPTVKIPKRKSFRPSVHPSRRAAPPSRGESSLKTPKSQTLSIGGDGGAGGRRCLGIPRLCPPLHSFRSPPRCLHRQVLPRRSPPRLRIRRQAPPRLVLIRSHPSRGASGPRRGRL